MRDKRPKSYAPPNEVVRFNRYRVIEHWILIALFIILMLTGFTAKLYDNETLASIFGGFISTARLNNLHFTTGYLAAILLTTHIVNAVYGVTFKGWAKSIAVTYYDFTCMTLDARYYLGISDHPANCGRYSYKEKFTYWAVLVFSLTMVTSGIALHFPDIALQIFPAEIIPTAKVTHVNTALLLATVAVWHVYESIFSPESFPLKKTIFTGRISIDEMKRDHPLEFEDSPSTFTDDGG